jgi:hypothetical protein
MGAKSWGEGWAHGGQGEGGMQGPPSSSQRRSEGLGGNGSGEFASGALGFVTSAPATRRAPGLPRRPPPRLPGFTKPPAAWQPHPPPPTKVYPERLDNTNRVLGAAHAALAGKVRAAPRCHALRRRLLTCGLVLPPLTARPRPLDSPHARLALHQRSSPTLHRRPPSPTPQGGISSDPRAEKALVALLLAPLGKCAPVAVLGLVRGSRWHPAGADGAAGAHVKTLRRSSW